MNATRFVILTLTLFLVCSLNHSLALYPEGIDFSATTTILDATHLVVGEITDVSFVFELRFTGPEYPDGWATSGPLSIVTFRVDMDMKEAIDRAENPDKPKDEANTIRFAQVGGPDRDGNVTEAAGVRRLKKGEYVFLKLVPSNYPITHNGITVHDCPRDIGSMYDVEKKGKDNVDKHIITRGWSRLDVTVLDMTRIVRATLKKPETMRPLAKKISRLGHLAALGRLAEDLRLQMVMDTVAEIEKELKLPDLKSE